MLFNSIEFIFFFLPTVFSVYFLFTKIRLFEISKIWLILASLFFYGFWNIDYVPLIISSILINFYLGRFLVRRKKNLDKKIIFLVGIIINISILGFFKYFDFIIFNINQISGSNMSLMNIALPLAISFFTLQQIAFLVDCYEGVSKEKSLINYSLFVVFFPQLIAGPIVHHKNTLSQFSDIKNKRLNLKNVQVGILIFSIGLFKKIVLADNLAEIANPGFTEYYSHDFYSAWLTAVAYSLQLYFDFSGYADMAIGSALLFNIKLPINFNSPLKSTSIIEFWSKWHISLTNFINAYIYNPLLLSFKQISFSKAMFATFISIMIAGIWHGAAWSFFLYGLVHSLALIANHLFRKNRLRLNRYLSWILFFIFINCAFVIFRAETLTGSFNIILSMFSFSHLNEINTLDLIIVIFAFLLIFPSRNSTFYYENGVKSNFKVAVFLAVIMVINFASISEPSTFIYFQF